MGSDIPPRGVRIKERLGELNVPVYFDSACCNNGSFRAYQYFKGSPSRSEKDGGNTCSNRCFRDPVGSCDVYNLHTVVVGNAAADGSCFGFAA